MANIYTRTLVETTVAMSLITKLAGVLANHNPHMMVFSPYYENSMLGGDEFGSPLPFVSDDAGTPFAVVLIPVDDRLAVKARSK